MSTEAATFEDTLAQLETRVRALESGDVPLDKALTLFEEGVELSRACHEQLQAAEERVSVLSRADKGIVDSPLEEPK